jgi:hypothetical protein
VTFWHENHVFSKEQRVGKDFIQWNLVRFVALLFPKDPKIAE